MDDPLARHLVYERGGLSERRFDRRQVAVVNRGPNVLQRAPQAGAQLAVVVAVLQALPVRFDGRCVFGRQIVYNLP